MYRENLIKQLNSYFSGKFIFNTEYITLNKFIRFIETNTNCFERSNIGHITASSWIVSHDFNKVLLTHHRKLNMWLQLGGHCDGDSNTANVALKEAIEESGIESFEFIVPQIFDIDIHPIPSKCETHYDIRYLLKAPENTNIKISSESLDLAWVDINKISLYTKEPSIVRMKEKFEIYLKNSNYKA